MKQNKKDHYVRVDGKRLRDENSKVLWYTAEDASKVADKFHKMGKKTTYGKNITELNSIFL
tara:strand:+ start:412 stop:594 length:183 start_codon:yes stop_codon:yes gene_type:complete